MTHIKKLSMQGFKSFAKKTEIYFDKDINVIVGPNGSGKSNISDALCFVLGRLSIKSMRAAKAKNLLFMGSKQVKPSREAHVEITFDNTDKTFNLPNSEISLKRIVKHSGVSVYKINGETKTRGEVIETLAQAGIDPHGYNLILQGQIQAIVKMHPEERRKILEEVSGISIYESRKEKSIKELDKTESRLKEITTVLRERTSFLRNLERERSQALRYKELEKSVNRIKYSILHKKISIKEKESTSIKKSISEKTQQKEEIKKSSEEIQSRIESLNEQILRINIHIKKSTGVERDSLQEKISDLRAELEGLKVRKENNENRKSELARRIEQMKSSIPEHESEISDLQKKSPLMAKKQESLKAKKQELSELEDQKNKVFSSKSELNSLKDRIKNEESRLKKIHIESDSLMKQIEELTLQQKYKSEGHCLNKKTDIKKEISTIQEELEKISELLLHHNKSISTAETHIQNSEEVMDNISKIDMCPLCQNKMTEEHLNHVTKHSKQKINNSKKTIKEFQIEITKHTDNKSNLDNNILKLQEKLTHIGNEISSHKLIIEKQNYVKRLVEEIKLLETTLEDLKSKSQGLENSTTNQASIIERYNAKLHEIEEISSRTEEDLDTTLLFKQRELEKINQAIDQNQKDLEEISSDLQDLFSSIEDKSSILTEKEQEESDLNKKFKKMFDDRDSLQGQIQDHSLNLSTLQNELTQVGEQVNFLKVGNAKFDAEIESLNFDLQDLQKVDPLKLNLQVLEEKLNNTKNTLNSIGAINLRALEVYDEVKKEYDKVYGKVEILDKEKQEIMKIIQEIDNKKKRTFMKTYKGINSLFSQNFAQLSAKGQATLEIQNKEDLFSGGVDISIKMGKGKYFDVTSLSGGEQTLIALSLLFAIQEHKPYHFYIFDEIDAALDKRNSERLSGLLKKYMKQGQYIVVTHNDAIITDSKLLYGVSMHEGISKVLSLKLD